MRGSLLRPWPGNEIIKVLNCTFNPGKEERDFYVNTEVEAEDEEQAKVLGRENCIDALNFFKFCINEQILLDVCFEEIKKDKESVTHCSVGFPAKLTITNKNPISSSQIQEIKKVNNSFSSMGEKNVQY